MRIADLQLIEAMNINNMLLTGPPAPPATLELTLNDPAISHQTRRKITAVDRRIRLETHKLHLICLLYHVKLRNRWIDLPEVRNNLPAVIPQSALNKLHHDPADQQFRRSKLFVDGLRESAQVFSKKWKINHRGLVTPQWHEPEKLKQVRSLVFA